MYLQGITNTLSAFARDGHLLWTNNSHSYHLVLGKKREVCVWYTEHVKLWCHQKMSCWRGLVPCICKNTGIPLPQFCWILTNFFALWFLRSWKHLLFILSIKEITSFNFPDSGGTATCNFWQQFWGWHNLSFNGCSGITTYIF